MFELPVLDKLMNLKNMIFSSILFIILFFIFILIIVLMLIFKKKKKLIFFVSLISIIGILIFISFNKFNIFIDYFIDVLFSFIYYPNFTLYCIFIFIINVIMINLLNKNNFLSKVTIIIYYSIMFLFILTIKIIDKENIDIHSKISIFGNNYLLSFIEISTFLFTNYLLFCLLRNVFYKVMNLKSNVKLKQVIIDELERGNLFDKLNIDIIEFNDINMTEFNKTNDFLVSIFNNTL